MSAWTTIESMLKEKLKFETNELHSFSKIMGQIFFALDTVIMYPDVVKHRAIIHYKHYCRNIRYVASIYKVGKSTLCRWLQADGATKKRKTSKTLVERISHLIKTLLVESPFLTTKQLSKKVHSTLNTKASASTCWRAIRKSGYSFKRTRIQVRKPGQGSYDQSFRSRYLGSNNIVSIDETFFYVSECPRYGYSKRGEALKHTVPRAPRTKKLTLYAAVSDSKVVGYKVSTSHGNSKDFVAFLKSLDISNSTLLMDNVAFHKTKEVKSYAESVGCRLLYVPPYSPDYNPIELAFSKIKGSYRVGVLSKSMEQAVLDAIASVTRSDLEGFFARTKRLVQEMPLSPENLSCVTDVSQEPC